VFVYLLISSTPPLAPRGYAEYDMTQKKTLQGTIALYERANPYSRIGFERFFRTLRGIGHENSWFHFSRGIGYDCGIDRSAGSSLTGADSRSIRLESQPVLRSS
jgi:hypothetical protein